MKQKKLSIPVPSLLFSVYALADVLVHAGQVNTMPVSAFLALVVLWCCSCAIATFFLLDTMRYLTLLPFVVFAAMQIVLLDSCGNVLAYSANVAGVVSAMLPAVYCLICYLRAEDGPASAAAARILGSRVCAIGVPAVWAALALGSAFVYHTALADALVCVLGCAAFACLNLYLHNPAGPYSVLLPVGKATADPTNTDQTPTS